MTSPGTEVSDLIARKPLWRRWRVVTSVILLGVIAGLGYYGYARQSKTTAPVTTQEVRVSLGSLSTTLTASGTAAAEQSTPLTFSTGGVVTDVLVRLGDEVKSGQPLIRLDQREAARNVETAKSNLELARLKLRALLEPSAVDRTATQQSLVSARTQLENAEAAYKNLGKPTASEKIAAENAVASARTSVQSALNSVETSRASLSQAQNAYCSLQFETTLGICTPDKLPIAPEYVTMLQTSIARNTSVPTNQLISAVNTLISANSAYVNALANRDTSAASVVAAEAKLIDLTNPTAEAVRSALAAVQTARAAYDSAVAKADTLGKPTDLDLGTQQQAVRAAEIALQTAQDTLTDMTLLAPFSGRVGTVSAIVGQRLGSGATALVLSNPDAVRMDLTIAEADLVNLKPGMLGFARFDSLSRNVYVVKVLGVSPVPTVTQGVVTYPVQAAILRGNALNEIRDQLPTLTRALTSGASGAQLGAILGQGGQGGRAPGAGAAGASGTAGAGGAQGTRPAGSGTPGANGGQGQRQGTQGAASATASASATGTASGTGTPTGTRPPGGGTGTPGAAGAGANALFNAPLPAAGMNASITLLVSVTENQLLVPTGAVRRQGNQTFVYQPGPDGGAPVQKPVVTGGTDGTNTAIVSGLAEGDVVLLGAIGTATPTASRTAAGGQPGGAPPGPGGPGGVGGGPGGGIR